MMMTIAAGLLFPNLQTTLMPGTAKNETIWLFIMTIVAGHWVCYSELPHLPIKLSYLGRHPVGYWVFAAGMSLVGTNMWRWLSVFPDATNRRLGQVGAVLIALVGIVNDSRGWLQLAHIPITVGCVVCYLFLLRRTGARTGCLCVAAAALVMDHAIGLAQIMENPTATSLHGKRLRAVCQYLMLGALALPLFKL